MRLTLERRRKNDRMDARELCVRLSRYLDGHRHELKPIRIPSSEEQQRRELGRQREFFKRELRRLENHGRALRIEHEHETLPAGWAGPRKWKQLSGAVQRVRARTTRTRGRADPRLSRRSWLGSPQARSAGGAGKDPARSGRAHRLCWMAKCATGIVSNIAKPSAVTPAVAPANIQRRRATIWPHRPARATNTCACCWSKRCGDY